MKETYHYYKEVLINPLEYGLEVFYKNLSLSTLEQLLLNRELKEDFEACIEIRDIIKARKENK